MSFIYIMFYALLAMSVVTTATYGILAPWYSSTIGKHLFGLLASLVLSFTLMASTQIPGVDRTLLWFSAFGVIFIGLLGLWVAILAAQGKTTRHIEEDRLDAEARTGELPHVGNTEP